MAIILTHHARERMALRGITEETIEEVIFTPDWSEAGPANRVLAFKHLPRGLLKVVYRVEDGDHIVVSAIWED
jgi:hypothetical protein